MITTIKNIGTAAALLLAVNAFAETNAAKPAAPSPSTTATMTSAKGGETTTTTNPREIDFNVVKKEDGVHWEPESITVHPGEKIRFVVKHDLQGGFDFHGFTIRELGISEKIDRNKTKTLNVEVPTTLKAGEYQVLCQFHPAHKPSKMEVTAGTGATPETNTGVVAPPANDQAAKTLKKKSK